MQVVPKKQRRFLFRPGAISSYGAKCSKPKEIIAIEDLLHEVATLLGTAGKYLINNNNNPLNLVEFDASRIQQIEEKTASFLKHCVNLLPLSHCEEIALDSMYLMHLLFTGNINCLTSMHKKVIIQIAAAMESRGDVVNNDEIDAYRWYSMALFAMQSYEECGSNRQISDEERNIFLRLNSKILGTVRIMRKEGGSSYFERSHWARICFKYYREDSTQGAVEHTNLLGREKNSILRLFSVYGLSFPQIGSLHLNFGWDLLDGISAIDNISVAASNDKTVENKEERNEESVNVYPRVSFALGCFVGAVLSSVATILIIRQRNGK